MLVTHGRQGIVLLRGFPAEENCLLQRGVQSFCDSISVTIFCLLLTGNIARGEVVRFRLLIC